MGLFIDFIFRQSKVLTEDRSCDNADGCLLQEGTSDACLRYRCVPIIFWGASLGERHIQPQGNWNFGEKTKYNPINTLTYVVTVGKKKVKIYSKSKRPLPRYLDWGVPKFMYYFCQNPLPGIYLYRSSRCLSHSLVAQQSKPVPWWCLPRSRMTRRHPLR